MARTPQPWMESHLIPAIRCEIDDIFSRSLGHTSQHLIGSALPPVETFRDGNEYVMRLDLPGIDPKEMEVTVSGDVVTLRGSREHHDKQESWDVIYCELVHGDFERKLKLPQGIRTEDIKAFYHLGVLELRMPAPKEALVHRVTVRIQKANDE